MSVFKMILKSTRDSLSTIIIYSAVFIIFGTVSSRANETTRDTMFEDATVKVAVTDNDNSVLSRSLTAYLEKTQEVVAPGTDSYTEMNDNVRFEIYNYALIIPEGFEARVLQGGTGGVLEYIAPGATASQYLLTEKIDTYIRDVMVYLECDYTMEEAVSLTEATMLELSAAQASILDSPDEEYHSFYSGMFTFNGYTLLMILCICISTVLSVTKNRDVRNRISVSGMRFMTRNLATIAAVFFEGLALTTVLTAVIILMGRSTEDGKLLFYVINTAALMFVGIGMAYLLSSITTSISLINMLSNMILLSMCFICGVFVNIRFLSPGILKAAHFLPLYWYTAAVRLINDIPADRIAGSDFYGYVLTQLLFACVFFGAGLVISRKKEQYAV